MIRSRNNLMYTGFLWDTDPNLVMEICQAIYTWNVPSEPLYIDFGYGINSIIAMCCLYSHLDIRFKL